MRNGNVFADMGLEDADELKQELKELRAKVQEGLSDIEEGRGRDFDPERIIRKGEQQLQNPESSA